MSGRPYSKVPTRSEVDGTVKLVATMLGIDESWLTSDSRLPVVIAARHMAWYKLYMLGYGPKGISQAWGTGTEPWYIARAIKGIKLAMWHYDLRDRAKAAVKKPVRQREVQAATASSDTSQHQD